MLKLILLTCRLPSVSLQNLSALPSSPGVYYAVRWHWPFCLLYVGMASNLRRRWNRQHHKYAALARQKRVRLYYRKLPTEYHAAEVEAKEIQRWQPLLNQVNPSVVKARARRIAKTKDGLMAAVLALLIVTVIYAIAK